MAKKKRTMVECTRVELDGIRYVIVREQLFDRLCQKAGVQEPEHVSPEDAAVAEFGLDGTSLAEKLIRRRRATGISQAGQLVSPGFVLKR